MYDVDAVKAWLVMGRADPELASTILETGGFACWATLTQLGLEHLKTNFMFAAERMRILDLCYSLTSNSSSSSHGRGHRKHLVKHHMHEHHSKINKTVADSNSSGVMCNRQHNGFGNQMFQYVFSRLAADSLGEWLHKYGIFEVTIVYMKGYRFAVCGPQMLLMGLSNVPKP